MHDLHFQRLLQRNAQKKLQRQRITTYHRAGDLIQLADQTLINFSSNDYLGLSQHPDVKKAYIEGVQNEGLGSGSSAIVSGFSKDHQALEEAFAIYLNQPRALLFNSGYHANLGVLSTLADHHSVIVADKLSHASLMDGALLSRATLRRFQHNDCTHAEKLLQRYTNQKHKLLVTESVFSIQGDVAPVSQLAALAKTHKALFLLDDAHGIGILGKTGRGIMEQANLSSSSVTCLITPLGKALGSLGAMVSGSQAVIEMLMQFARTYRYTTALPAAICKATLSGLKALETEHWRRDRLLELITFFRFEAEKRGFKLRGSTSTPIQSILIGENEKTHTWQKKLMQQGFLVACIRPPTVPHNQACLRISLTSTHHKKQIIDLLTAIQSHENQSSHPARF